MTRLLACVFLGAAALAACATTSSPSDDDFVTTDLGDAPNDDPKADQADLAFTAVDGLALKASVGKTEEGRVIRTAAAFKTAFGIAPPADLDFTRSWLAIYSAGQRPTGGYDAAITRVALSDSGKTVKVTSSLVKPGTGCTVTSQVTKPVAIVKFAAQPGAAASYFARRTSTRVCEPLCGAALDTALASAAQGMTYMSESDYPLTVVDHAGAGAPTIAKLRALEHVAAGTAVEQRSFAAFMDKVGTAYDPNDPYIVEYAAKWRALRAVMEQDLTDLTVIRVGTISITVYLVGTSACGDLVGFSTTSIET